jgi:Fe-S-cluster-containing hydrogenase component 2
MRKERIKSLFSHLTTRPIGIIRGFYRTIVLVAKQLIILENPTQRILPKSILLVSFQPKKLSYEKADSYLGFLLPQRIHVDYTKCTGCKACELACSLKHFGRCEPEESRIRIDRQCKKSAEFFPFTCQHCTMPECTVVCPSGACTRTDKGLVEVDPELCIGCKFCIIVCPLSSAAWNWREGKSMRCDLCEGEPVCVEVCSTKAIEFY